jgi:hypothetical protein
MSWLETDSQNSQSQSECESERTYWRMARPLQELDHANNRTTAGQQQDSGKHKIISQYISRYKNPQQQTAKNKNLTRSSVPCVQEPRAWLQAMYLKDR